MRDILWLCLIVVGALPLSRAKQAPDVSPSASNDRYSVVIVKSTLQFLTSNGIGGKPEIRMYIDPLLPLGDRVSIAVLKIYSAEELVQSKNAEAYLTVVRNAFSSRRSVLEKSDTDPRVTLFVLEYLAEKEVASSGLEKRIAYMKQCVRDFSCSSQGEFDFFHQSNE